jgi:hypothetical protein
MRCLLLLALAGCPAGVERGGDDVTGGARWAYDRARPAMATDAQLYAILGASIEPDGRLPANTGSWTFVTWSATTHEARSITVVAAGDASAETRTSATGPSASREPLPDAWADSQDVFAAVQPHLPCNVTTAPAAALNVMTYPEAMGQVAWAINYDVGANQLVKWDGTYLGALGTASPPCKP